MNHSTISKKICHIFAVLSFTLVTPFVLAEEPSPDNALQIELPETLVDAVPTSDSFISSVQPTFDHNEEGPTIVAINDPWEGYNRNIYNFNLKADKYVLRPVAVAYDTVTPKPVQYAVRNFFSNLKSPVIMVNELLQGRPMDSAETLGRFAVNTTVGIVGIFDPASAIGLEPRNEDFGQTLALWGWENSDYVVLPLLGPNTIRDFVGFIGGIPLSPTIYMDGGAATGMQSLEITDMRVQLMAMDEVRASAIDEYAMMRDAWSQRRRHQIQEGLQLQKNRQGRS